ncbi:MAG: hypothetical protein JNL11_17100 [Bdellovibrionaceae bacterium]|nr:hypothetical protein [Pseudobdellovibrionaceae bacterium]
MKSIFNYVLMVMLLLQAPFARTQENNSPQPITSSNEPKEENKRDFDSLHSLGYQPKQDSMSIDFFLITSDSDYAVFIKSTPSSKLTKLNDTKGTSSSLSSSLQYGIDDKTRVGLTLNNVLNSNFKYTYTAEGKNAGYTDYSVSSKGNKEPSISINRTLKETNDLRVYGFLTYSPQIGKSSDSNVLRGGSATRLGFDLIKSFEKTEFLFGIDYTHYGVRFYEEGATKRETKDGNDLKLAASLNFRTAKDSSFVVYISRNMSDFSTLKYENSTTATEIDSSFQTNYILGYQFSMAEDLLFQIGYAGYIVDEVTARSGSQTIVVDPTTGGGISFGMKLGF